MDNDDDRFVKKVFDLVCIMMVVVVVDCFEFLKQLSTWNAQGVDRQLLC